MPLDLVLIIGIIVFIVVLSIMWRHLIDDFLRNPVLAHFLHFQQVLVTKHVYLQLIIGLANRQLVVIAVFWQNLFESTIQITQLFHQHEIEIRFLLLLNGMRKTSHKMLLDHFPYLLSRLTSQLLL